MTTEKQCIDGSALLHDITQFLARFLQCSEHQRTILALWVLHTYCYYTAEVTPYLSIQSTDKQSGKTLCLQLLSLLCENPALTSGFTVHKLTARMSLRPVSAILLDECQAIVGTRSRPKTPVLRGLLASGFHRGLGYTGPFEEDDIFCPKAFAGRGPLPEELADRSIPIILQPLQPHTSEIINNDAGGNTVADDGKTPNANHKSSTTHQEFPVERFHHYVALKATEPLCERLAAWGEKHLPVLEKMPPYKEYDFPPNLSPRRQDLCEPLLQLAHLVGGPWPTRLGEALISTFAEEADFHLQHSRQLLADLRDCLADHGYPERIQTTTLLDWLHSLPARPWDTEGSLSAYKLARMLGAFAIRPRNQRIGKGDKPLRGYQLEHFQEAWEKHLGFEVPQSEIAKKDAVCNTVSDVGKLAVSVQVGVLKVSEPQENPEWTAAAGVPDAGRVCTQRGEGAPGCVFDSPCPENGRKKETVDGAVTQAPSAMPASLSKPAKNAACDTFSHAPKIAQDTQRTDRSIAKPLARSQQPEARPPEMSVDTLHGIHRLKTLHSKLRLQGLCPPFEALAASYSPRHLHAALDWVEAHPEWCSNMRYKPALEFVAAFQKTLAILTMKGV